MSMATPCARTDIASRPAILTQPCPSLRSATMADASSSTPPSLAASGCASTFPVTIMMTFWSAAVQHAFRQRDRARAPGEFHAQGSRSAGEAMHGRLHRHDAYVLQRLRFRPHSASAAKPRSVRINEHGRADRASAQPHSIHHVHRSTGN